MPFREKSDVIDCTYGNEGGKWSNFLVTFFVKHIYLGNDLGNAIHGNNVGNAIHGNNICCSIHGKHYFFGDVLGCSQVFTRTHLILGFPERVTKITISFSVIFRLSYL